MGQVLKTSDLPRKDTEYTEKEYQNIEVQMDLLSRKEELLLAIIWKLEDDAYGISIRDELEHSIGVKWLFGSIYTPLSKLYDKGLITKSEEHASSDRGGRPKVTFQLTPEGRDALVKMRTFSNELWTDVPPITTG